MRDILKQQILLNSDQLISDLNEYSRTRSYQQNSDDIIPTYNIPLQDVIRYRFIEEEVRCGQYYLRVWTQIKPKEDEFFWIPYDEEDDFLRNL